MHLLAVPMFTLALAHGVFAGTDTERPWMFVLYAVTGLVVVFLTIASPHVRVPASASDATRAIPG